MKITEKNNTRSKLLKMNTFARKPIFRLQGHFSGKWCNIGNVTLRSYDDSTFQL